MREHVMITELFIILDSMEVNKLRTNNLANNSVNNLANTFVNKYSIMNYIFSFL